MGILDAVSLLLAVALFIYLLVALLRADRNAVARGSELGAAVMQAYDYWLILAFLALVLLPAPALGRFYYNVMEGRRTWLTPVLGPVLSPVRRR